MTLRVVLMAVLLAFTSCRISDKSGTTHHLVLGFGVVSVSRSNSIAQVVKTTSVGVGIGNEPGKLIVGYRADMATYIKTNANVVIEVDQRPGKPIKIEAQ